MQAKAHLRLKQVGARFIPDYYTPESVLPQVKDKASLKVLLDQYAKPFIKHHTPDDVRARRHFVEKIRPTLRWFCKKFGEQVPSWLEGNGHYDELPPEEHEHLFGKEPLKVREFEERLAEPADPAAEGG